MIKLLTVVLTLGLWLGLRTMNYADAQATTPASGQSATTLSEAYKLASPKTLQTALKNPDDVVLINVHIPYEGELPGTDTFVPFDKIAPLRARLPQDKAAKIAVYCMSGRMSEIAAKTLLELGYTDVTDLRGGMIAWQKAGFSLAER